MGKINGETGIKILTFGPKEYCESQDLNLDYFDLEPIEYSYHSSFGTHIGTLADDAKYGIRTAAKGVGAEVITDFKVTFAATAHKRSYSTSEEHEVYATATALIPKKEKGKK